MEFYYTEEAKEHLAKMNLSIMPTETDRLLIVSNIDGGLVCTGLYNKEDEYVLIPYDVDIEKALKSYMEELEIWNSLDSE